jgi:hypothetical protein
LCYKRFMGIPYGAIGIGIAVIFGVWAFFVAETVRARAIIASIPVLIFVIGSLLQSLAGQLISLFGWVIYGIGCIIYLRLNGMQVR